MKLCDYRFYVNLNANQKLPWILFSVSFACNLFGRVSESTYFTINIQFTTIIILSVDVDAHLFCGHLLICVLLNGKKDLCLWAVLYWNKHSVNICANLHICAWWIFITHFYMRRFAVWLSFCIDYMELYINTIFFYRRCMNKWLNLSDYLFLILFIIPMYIGLSKYVVKGTFNTKSVCNRKIFFQK